jgi:hypothetical protein
VPRPDFGAALGSLANDACYSDKAHEFAVRYAGHDRDAALNTIIQRVEASFR